MPVRVLMPPPTAPSTLQGSRRAIPPDLIRDASRRLRILALVAAVLWVIGSLTGHLAGHVAAPDNPHWSDLTVADGIAGVSALVSLALFAYLRRHERDPNFLLNLGL